MAICTEAKGIPEVGDTTEKIKMSDFDNIQFDPITTEAALSLDNSVNLQGYIDINGMWNAGYIGTGVNVAIFDNGVSPIHPGLENKLNQSVDFSGDDYNPCYSHGTPV